MDKKDLRQFVETKLEKLHANIDVRLAPGFNIAKYQEELDDFLDTVEKYLKPKNGNEGGNGNGGGNPNATTRN